MIAFSYNLKTTTNTYPAILFELLPARRSVVFMFTTPVLWAVKGCWGPFSILYTFFSCNTRRAG